MEYQAIKNLSWVESSDQGKFSSIKNLDPGRKWFYRPYESDYPLIHVWYDFLYHTRLVVPYAYMLHTA